MQNLQKRIVVIEDDRIMARLVKVALTGDGFDVATFGTAEEGTGPALEPETDLIVLDLNLPDADGIDVARFIRSSSKVPIIMLTGRRDVASRVQGLDAGADDYLSKPFNVEELRARVRSILRRSDLDGQAADEADTGRLTVGRWHLDREQTSIEVSDGDTEKLTEREFMILAMLMGRAGTVVPRDEIQRQAAGRQLEANDRSLDVHVSRLRRKLSDISGGLEPIKTVRGIGFLFAK